MMEQDTPPRPTGMPATSAMRRPAVEAPESRSAFAPLLLLTIAFVAWLGFQAMQQFGERQQIAAVQAGLDPQELAARKVRSALDAVANGTAKLANDGNASARLIVEELRKRGITINVTGAPKPG